MIGQGLAPIQAQRCLEDAELWRGADRLAAASVFLTRGHTTGQARCGRQADSSTQQQQRCCQYHLPECEGPLHHATGNEFPSRQDYALATALASAPFTLSHGCPCFSMLA